MRNFEQLYRNWDDMSVFSTRYRIDTLWKCTTVLFTQNQIQAVPSSFSRYFLGKFFNSWNFKHTSVLKIDYSSLKITEFCNGRKFSRVGSPILDVNPIDWTWLTGLIDSLELFVSNAIYVIMRIIWTVAQNVFSVSASRIYRRKSFSFCCLFEGRFNILGVGMVFRPDTNGCCGVYVLPDF